MKVLEIRAKDGSATYEVHALEANEFFPNFGGSRSGLTTGKTASLIVKRRSGMGEVDTEYPLYGMAQPWAMIAELINSTAGACEAKAFLQESPPK